jgi:hypothetical protein
MAPGCHQLERNLLGRHRETLRKRLPVSLPQRKYSREKRKMIEKAGHF